MVNSQPPNSNFADGWGPQFDHMALVVSIPGGNNDGYLVDVGWGMFIVSICNHVRAVATCRVIPHVAGPLASH